ncbi:ABC-2 type transport system permease protein [Lacrimispora xylanisolvens]|uniref:ABC-2 type transport system permease protein n=1 Tax=Lacrimispora xylanisolvens TaxID=384636 RepID=A0A2S6HH23_9FIRM|nr:ABC-2 family transporter protein [Hungatella xylanolytica]PPK76785.1 ABC-2 type transport system permease protein [Hungatella xylanolytica]
MGLRKYLEILKIFIKTQLAWRGDSVIQILFSLTRILFASLLWGTIFAGRDEVAGFTLSSMMSYYIISSFLTQLDMSSKVSMEISQRIRNGTFSKYMVLPVNIQGYFVAMEMGMVLFHLIIYFITSVIWVFIFRIRFVFAPDPAIVAGIGILILLGLFFMAQLNYYLGLLTLKYEEIGLFLMIKDNLVAFVTGSIIPLTLLPEHFLWIMKAFPFYYVTYLPSMLLIGRLKGELGMGLLVLFCWCVVLQAIIHVTWQNYRIKYDGVGI